MERSTKVILACSAGIFALMAYAFVFQGPDGFTSFVLGKPMEMIVSGMGILGLVYPATRAIVRIAGGPLFPAIPLPGGWIAKCSILAVIGLVIGMLAPLWAAACWAFGAAIMFSTKGIE